MNYWIFVATDPKEYNLTARQTYDQRMKDKFWGIGEKTPNRTALRKGDKAVFYIGSPEKVFVGDATLDSDYFKLSEVERNELSHNNKFFKADFGVRLTEINIWQAPRPVSPFISSLHFIENKEYWGAYFQGGIRRIDDRDFTLILQGISPSLTRPLGYEEVPVNESDFGLESYLEQFIEDNWDNIFGGKLKPYMVAGQSGRQFPAGEWSIDFLSIDEKTGDFVVIELKKGRTSAYVVGQIQAYMAWVRENLATSGQQVRGIIIAHAVDDKLKYAVRYADNIAILTYKVDFELREIKKDFK